MNKLSGCYSHKTDDWKTPKNIYDQYMKKGYIDTFPYKANYDEFRKE